MPLSTALPRLLSMMMKMWTHDIYRFEWNQLFVHFVVVRFFSCEFVFWHFRFHSSALLSVWWLMNWDVIFRVCFGQFRCCRRRRRQLFLLFNSTHNCHLSLTTMRVFYFFDFRFCCLFFFETEAQSLKTIQRQIRQLNNAIDSIVRKRDSVIITYYNAFDQHQLLLKLFSVSHEHRSTWIKDDFVQLTTNSDCKHLFHDFPLILANIQTWCDDNKANKIFDRRMSSIVDKSCDLIRFN